MELLAEDVSGGGAAPRTLPLHRAGDIALFLVWTLFAASAVAGAIDDGRKNDFLAAAHHGMVAAVFLVNATLFLLRGPAVKRGAGLAPMLIAFVGTWSILPLSMLPLTWRPGWLLVTTSAGMIAAYAFVLWALLALRRNFSILPEARKLVRHGPYALVRHPLYAAYILTYLLIALPRFGPAALALAVLGIAGEAWRAHNEERVLAAAFPDYVAYAAATPRFVPALGGNYLSPRRESAHDHGAGAL